MTPSRRPPAPLPQRPLAVAGLVLLLGPVPLACLAAASSVDAPWWRSRAATMGDWLLLPLLAAVLAELLRRLPPTPWVGGGWLAGATLGGLTGLCVQVAWLLDPAPEVSWVLPARHSFSAGGWWHAGFVVTCCAALGGMAWSWAQRARFVRMNYGSRPLSQWTAVAALTYLTAGFLGLVGVDGMEQQGADAQATVTAAALAAVASVALVVTAAGWRSAAVGLAVGGWLATVLVMSLVAWPSLAGGLAATAQVAGASVTWWWHVRREGGGAVAEVGGRRRSAARRLQPSDGRRIRVAAVDDHPTMLAGLRATLEADPRFELVVTAGSHHELLASGVEFDVVVLDLYLHGDPRDGKAADFEAVEILSTRFPTLVLTSAARDEDVYDVMHNFAVAGYLVKDVTPDRLREAVATVAAGGQALTPEYAQALVRELGRRRELMSLPALTGREIDVLELVAEGMTDQQIAAELGIGATTVNHHMKSLRRKLGEHAGNRWQLARMAFELGLADPPVRRRRWPNRSAP